VIGILGRGKQHLTSPDAARDRAISVYRLGEMPIQSCGQSVSAPRGKAGARLNAHTELWAKRQRSAREAIYRNRPIPLGILSSTLPEHPTEHHPDTASNIRQALDGGGGDKGGAGGDNSGGPKTIGRGLHSLTSQLNLSGFLWDRGYA